MKPAWITSVTVHCGAICRMNIKRQVANLESCGAFDSLRPVFNTLIRGETLNSGLRTPETRHIAASYGVERSTDYYFVLSQYTRLTDRQTDGRTDVDSKSSPLHVDARQKRKITSENVR